MAAKKKAAKKAETPKVRIRKGSLSCNYDSVSQVIESLIHLGFRVDDLTKTSIELDYSYCYYESDRPSIYVTWNDIN